MTGLLVSGLHKSFGRAAPVLRGVDLGVTAGSLTALIGRSGCGKTTLLRMIAGFDRPDAGTVTIADRTVTGPGVHLPPERRRIGYVTQEGNLFPHLSVAGNISYGLPWRDRRARRGVPELLDLVGLDASYAKRPPHELSGGEQQRVALARALAPRPDLVLLDEPFSALDPELRASTRRAVLDALATTGTTTVLVTHDRSEALSLASQVAVLRAGVIVQEDTPAALYRRPVDDGVASFVGDVVRLPATLDGDVGDTALGRIELPNAATGKGFVLVRPEQIELTAPNDGFVAAVVEQVEFHGDDGIVRLRVETPHDPLEVWARCPAHRLPDIAQRVGLTLSGTALAARDHPSRDVDGARLADR